MKNKQRGEALLAMALITAIVTGGMALYSSVTGGTTNYAGTYQAIAQQDGSIVVMDTRDRSVARCRLGADGLDCAAQRTADSK